MISLGNSANPNGDGGPLVSSGQLMTWEGSWDEVVPPQVCTLPLGVTLADDPPPGLLSPLDCNKRNTWYTILNGYELEIVAEDEEWKREHMLRVLDNTEYLIIGTNRRYDSQNRIPLRWPLTNGPPSPFPQKPSSSMVTSAV